MKIKSYGDYEIIFFEEQSIAKVIEFNQNRCGCFEGMEFSVATIEEAEKIYFELRKSNEKSF